MKRCAWANASLLEQIYHDKEWGIPIHDDRLLFEFLILEAAQAGLSWSTILKKRKGYRKAYDNFEATKIANYSSIKMAELLSTPFIIRNKLKINSAKVNANAFLEVKAEFGSFDAYIWQFVDGSPIQNTWRDSSDIPVSTQDSYMMSKDLKERGFKFVGPKMCYAFMQAVGMVNDHLLTCYRYHKIKQMSE
ncbi:MAG: DNA-3-methyladenine glycosylase I [Thiotrichaceae bacterium]|nr:DNA-3-methyladenine glycosylase I [Thiotrichaceae bacterium]